MRITPSKLRHNNDNLIAIGFDDKEITKAIIKTVEGVAWSQTHKTYYVLYSKNTIHTLFNYFRSKSYFVDYSQFKKPIRNTYQPVKKIKPSLNILEMFKALPPTHKELLKDYAGFLKGKRLSESTIRSYGYFVLRFMNFYKPKAIQAI